MNSIAAIPRDEWMNYLERAERSADLFKKGLASLHPNPFLPVDPEDVIPMDENPELLAAVCENPEEDTPRLLYADWLDELAGWKSSKYGEAYSARAELIRLQTDVTRAPQCRVCFKTGRFNGQHKLYCALMQIDPVNTDIDPEKVVNVVCPACDNYAKQHRVRYLLDSKYPVPTRIPGAADARITGKELWTPAGMMSARETRFVRGFVGVASYTVSTYMAWVDTLCKAAPLERIVLSDRVLNSRGRIHGKIGFFYAPDAAFGTGVIQPPIVIPETLWDLTAALRNRDRADAVGDCYTWLSMAAVLHARCRAFGTVPHPRRPPDVPPMLATNPEVHFDREGVPWKVDLSDPYSVSTGVTLRAFVAGDPDLLRYKAFCSADLLDAFRAEVGVLDLDIPFLDSTLPL